jgi:hypothetical protein
MIEKNPKVKKFKLKFERDYGKNNEYSRYNIVGLERAFYDKNDDHSFANGACGLLKQEKYPGYCQLCFVYHTESSENFGNGYTVEFMPLLTKDGERILIKYGHDCCMCSIETGQIDYEEYHKTGIMKRSDVTLTFFNKGVCKTWDEEN